MPGLMAPLAYGKMNHFGIEVADRVIWQGWEPGQEYTRNITLKNVKVKTQKLKYKGPASRFFTTLYPKPIVLSAGTSYTLPVTFRPLEKVIYDDELEFDTSEGSFSVPIRALLPEVNIEVPDHINFDMCAAQDFRQLSFEIKNVSELETPFQIESQEPFVVEPPEGTLEPFSTVMVTVTFTPKAAVVYEADIIIKYGPDFAQAKVTRIEGIGKYPHLMVRSGASQPENKGNTETVVNFGQVCIGHTADKWIELHNLSPVNAPFTVEHPMVGPGQIDSVFQCLQKQGVVPAMAACRLPISYTPNTVGMKSVDYFHVKAIGNMSKSIIKCVGYSRGPRVSLSQNLINFLQVNTGEVATKTVDIINESDSEAVFQFQIDCSESVFKFEHLSGVLPPNSKRTIILRFAPGHPINYYRRVNCLIHNQNPLFLDLLGTCHAETVKPAVLQTKHLNRYKLHVDRGLSFTPPEQLNEQLHEGKLRLDNLGALYREEEIKELDTGYPSIESPAVHPMDEYFNDGHYSDITHFPPHVSLDVNQADFSQCTDINSVQQQTVNVTNHTNGKITVVWMGATSDFLSEPGHIFSVSPATLDLPPQSSSSFTVTFRPNAKNQFFGSELECYAYYKSLRDYRLVEETTHCPPWCLTLLATGHTFQPNNETFLPRYLLDSPNLTFPAVNAHEATYRTMLLANTGTTPILFDFDKDPEGVYSVKPTKGLIAPSGNQMFVVKCLPKAVKLYKHVLKLKLNAADKNDQDITMLGSAEAADVLLDEDGEMYFKPTCVGTASTRSYAVRNVSRIPLLFEWKMMHQDGKLLSVVPASGLIQPNESQFHTWSFTPKAQEKYVMKPALIIWGQGQSSVTSGGKKRQVTLRALGEGTVGNIKCEESYIQLGNIIVGSQTSHPLVLVNDSHCSLEYQLIVDQEVEAEYTEDEVTRDPLALMLEKTHGILPARSREIINCTAHPSRRACYRWGISYMLCTPQADSVDPGMTEPKFLTHVLTAGVFPTLSITDAHCYGSAIGISKKQLWSLFSLDSLNVSLDSDPSATELKYNVATRQSHCRRAPVYTRAVLDCNFSAAPVRSDPCVVQLMFENTGAVSTEWSFLFPNDLQIELEYWAETGEFDEEELHQLKVMDNKLFTVEPKRGRLDTGCCQTVTFTYQHIMPGTDRLPVLFKIARGREILLNFVGVTVEPERRYLHFPTNKYMFSPVPIGEKTSPKQIYELYNGGALSVKYEFDVLPLELLKQENFDHDIFEVMNPMGEIVPGQTLAIEWKFSPLEAKTYMVDVPIRVHNGETAIVTFTGVGYDKRAMGETMAITDNHEISGVPSVQSVSVPGQLCFLSQERMTFGNIPLFTKPRRVVVISNKSQEHGVLFKWHVTSKKDANVVSIYPREGRLPPGGAHMCKITFVSFGFPSFYDIDLICEVMNETDYNNYSDNLEKWNKEKERQKVEFSITKEDTVTNLTEFREYEEKLVRWNKAQERQRTEFTITENDLDADQRLASSSGEESPANSRVSSGKLRTLEVRTPSPDIDFTKYKTLPPIRQRSIDIARSKERAKRRFDAKFWAQPQPPKPFLLHLGVTARTHNVADFQQNFPEDYQNYCIDSTLCDEKDTGREPQATTEPPESVTCLSAEADLIGSAITDILRCLLDDTQFQDNCIKVVNSPVPYYRQMAPKRPESAPPATGLTETTDIVVDVDVESASAAFSRSGSAHSGSAKPRSASGQSGSVKSGSHKSKSIKSGSQPEISGLEDTVQEVPVVSGEEDVLRQSPSYVQGDTVIIPAAPSPSAKSSSSRSSSSSSSKSSKSSKKSSRPDTGVVHAQFLQKQALKKLPEFSNCVESMIENSLMNVLQEAFSTEFNITARPRLVALPPKPRSAGSTKK